MHFSVNIIDYVINEHVFCCLTIAYIYCFTAIRQIEFIIQHIYCKQTYTAIIYMFM